MKQSGHLNPSEETGTRCPVTSKYGRIPPNMHGDNNNTSGLCSKTVTKICTMCVLVRQLLTTYQQSKAGMQSVAFYLHTLMCADHSELVDIVGGILIPYKPCSIYQTHSSHLSTLHVMVSMITYCILHNVTNPLSIISVLEDSPVFMTSLQWHDNIHFKLNVTHMVVCNIDLPHIETDVIAANRIY